MKSGVDILFLSHGGGPLPLLGDDGHVEMVSCLQAIAGKLSKPSAIVVISAHWEASVPTVTSAAHPSLIYDYYGFPEESYHIQYPCPGDPVLAEKIQQLYDQAGVRMQSDGQRGFDHGLFVPLKIMYPQADIPCVQLSLVDSLDPLTHINMGRVLQNLDYDRLLVVGSGFSFHNLRAFFAPQSEQSTMLNEAFEGWLISTCADHSIDETQRAHRLAHWMDAPGARYCHPREEHLLPLHVCYGLAERFCSEYFELSILNKKSSMYLWTADSI